MSTEEPAWKAEARPALYSAGVEARDLDQVLEHLEPFIQAAEDRGRREALREAAEDLRTAVGRFDFPGEDERVKRFVAGWRQAADHIDPDSP